MRTKVLPINEVVLDKEIYPRTSSSWIVSYNYAQAMKTGSKFPPITVALLDGRYVLVDGKHRVDALKMNKEKYVGAEVLTGLTRKEAFIRAIELNISHGYPLTVYDKAVAVKKLENMKFTLKDISRIVKIPADKLATFVAQRLTNTVSGVPVVLKATLRHLVGEPVPEDTEERQEMFYSRTEISLIKQLIGILKEETFVKRDKKLAIALLELRGLINLFLKRNKRLVKNALK